MFSKILLLNFYLGILKNHFWCEIGKITLYSLWEFWVQERHMSLIQKSEFVVTTECALLLHNQLLWRSWQRVGLIIPRSPVRSWSGAYKCLYSSVWQSMRLVSARSRVRSSLEAFRVGVVGNISACHVDAPGSILGHGVPFLFLSPSRLYFW